MIVEDEDTADFINDGKAFWVKYLNLSSGSSIRLSQLKR